MINKEINDAELIRMVQADDEQAFNLLYERYVKLAYYIAFRFCNNDADSQDVVQETFLQIKRTIKDLKNPDLFKYWLNKITISKCKNLFRKNKYVTYDDEHYEAKNNLMETREDVQPTYLLKFNSDKEVMNALIDELPEGQREVVILHYLEQFSIEETASLLEIPEGTVKSRLSYARTALKMKVEQYEKENQIQLNFHSLDGLIAAALLASFAHFATPALSVRFVHKEFDLSKLFSTWTGKLALSVLLFACGGTAVIMTQSNSEEKEDTTFMKVAEEEVNTFPAITIRNTTITSARSAYYIIKTWACCEEEMNLLSQEELDEVYRLYQVMKNHNSTYYQSLEEEGWCLSLETIYRNKVQ